MRKILSPLLLILVLAAALRFYQINTNPKAMYGDGLTLVYDAYSLFKTGHDQKGNFLPLVFPLGGGRPAGYVYATVPFAALFGPTMLASQMVTVLSGIGIVLLLYLLGKELFSKTAGFFIAAVAAINPWELSLSRGPFESHFALFLTLVGIYSFIKGLKKQAWFIVFAVSFALAIQTYSTYKLTIPLLVIFLLIWSFKKLPVYLKKPAFLFSLLLIIASTLLGVYLTLNRGAEDRFDIINVFKDPVIRTAISQKIKNDRLLDSLSPTTAYLLHTPQLELMGLVAENYITNYLPDFLFLHGDGQVRHNPAEMGGFFWIDFFLIIIGIVFIVKNNRKILYFLIAWIIIAPISTSLVGNAHALRSSLLLPPLLIFAGIGLWQLFLTRQKPFSGATLAVLMFTLMIQFVFFCDRFYYVAPAKNAAAWSYPARHAVKLAIQNSPNFDAVILSNDIDNMEFAYPTYTKLDPNLVIKQNTNPARIGEFKFFKYGNVYIGSLPNTRVMQLIKDLPGTVLYIGAAKEKNELENYKTIRGFDKEEELVVVAKGKTPELD